MTFMNASRLLPALTTVLCLSILSGETLWAQNPATPGDSPLPLTADPARDLFEAASLAFAEGAESKNTEKQKVAYESSIRNFERFITKFPNDPRVPKARFYIASCQEKLGKPDAAISTYLTLARSDANGALAAAACQKLATTYYEAGKFEAAVEFFSKLATIASKPETRHYALYQRALCFQKLERNDDLKEALRAVVFDDGSPFQDRARAAIASLYSKDGEKKRAYDNYRLLADSQDPAIASEAILQSALLARELGDEATAAQWFQLILRTPSLSKWHGKARLTLMGSAFEKQDYETVIALFGGNQKQLPQTEEAQMLAMTAESYRKTGREELANGLYARLSKVSPDKSQAFDATYVVLTNQYQSGDKSFFQAGEDFLRKFEAAHNEDPRVDNVHLMLAERYYDIRSFAKAAQQYGDINLRRIDQANVSRLRYRLAFARMKSGNPQAARDSFSVFLANHPDDKLVPRALAHRGALQLTLGAEAAAQKDFEALLTRTQSSDLRLQALTGLAELYRKQEDYPQLVSIHSRLLSEFPQRSLRDRAASHFVLGWAYFRQDEFEKAMPEFGKARELSPKGLGKDATLHLALVHFARQDEAALQPELDRLLREFPDSGLPKPVYAWLGAKRAAEGSYEEAWKYLNLAVTPRNPSETKDAVWKAYTKTSEALGKHQETLTTTNYLIPKEESAYLRAVLIHRKAKALLGLREFAAATATATTALELKPQGDLNADLRLTLGDIERIQSNADEALSHYVVVAELIGKGALKATAIRKAAEVFESKGDATSLAEAKRYRAMLE